MFFGKLMNLGQDRKLRILLHQANQGLDDIIKLFSSGSLKPVIDRLFTLDRVPEALAYFEKGLVKGKIVINV